MSKRNESQKTENSVEMTRCLKTLLCFVGRETALEVVSEQAKLTKWGVINRLCDEGFHVIGEDQYFTIDTGFGLIELNTNRWELSFDTDSFESYFYKRASHLEDLMSKTHFFSQMVEKESATA